MNNKKKPQNESLPKISLFVESLQNSYGTERAVVSLANALSQLGFKVRIISVFKQSKSCKFDIHKDVSQIDMGIVSENKYLAYLLLIAKLILRKRYYSDSLNISSLLYISISLWISGVKAIAWEHVFSGYVNKFRSIIRNLVYRRLKYVVTTTISDRNYYRSKGINSAFIKNIVDTGEEDFIPTIAYSNQFLFVGRLEPEKGIEELVRILGAFYRQLGADINDHKTVVIGNGTMLQSLRSSVAALGLESRVHIVGEHVDPKSYYMKADAILCTSHSEGFGLAIVEGMQYGVPTVSFDIPAGPREIISHGNNGYLVPARNVDEYVVTLHQIYLDHNNYLQIRKNALNTSQAYRPEFVVNEWREIINDAHRVA